MTTPSRGINFSWPRTDVTVVRTHYLGARRIYRQPAPEALSLTLSAFTETAYRIARARMATWRDAVLCTSATASREPREALSLSWAADLAAQLDDDWDTLAELALHTQPGTEAQHPPQPRVQVWKSDVARLGVLNALKDWKTWIRSCHP